MTFSLARPLLGLAIWAACLAGALSVANVPWDLGHVICGPWGCAPPMQALIACHLAWFVALVPPAVLWVRWQRPSEAMLWRVGLLLVALAGVVLMLMMVHQRLVWWYEATEWQRAYLWQRFGFSIATAVELPVVQVLLIGLGFWLGGGIRWPFRCLRSGGIGGDPGQSPQTAACSGRCVPDVQQNRFRR